MQDHKGKAWNWREHQQPKKGRKGGEVLLYSEENGEKGSENFICCDGEKKLGLWK